MLTPPDGLPWAVLAEALRRSWGIAPASAEYLPVGWGSHHWAVAAGAAGPRWFVTADDLEQGWLAAHGPVAGRLARLRAALATARALRDRGARFVVAPVPTRDGEPVALVSGRFAVAVYPFVDGQSFSWGGFSSPAHRLGVLELVVAVHTAPAAASRHALADDFAVPHRDALAAALDPDRDAATDAAGDGPYARRAALLARGHATAVRQLLARHDGLAARARADPGRAVLTHGEPHPGNTMLTRDGWVLIDWDTALVAPPERDLWPLDPGDGSILAAYASATGVAPRPDLLELYRLRWDIADIAIGLGRFRRAHDGGAEDEKAWGVLAGLIERVSAAGPRGR